MPRKLLPWCVAGASLILYLVTLNEWVSLSGLQLVSKVTGWDWWSPNLEAPLFIVLTAPLRLLPVSWQPVALNIFSAVCAAGAIGFLARSVMLLPHDRTNEQRMRQNNPKALLTMRGYWVPPLLAVVVCGLQLTFWENAVVATGEALNILIFAFVVNSLLEYRLSKSNSRLYWTALVYGLGITNNWAMIGFLPAFLLAVVWIKGIEFFNTRFILGMLGMGLLGLLVYLVLPIIEVFGAPTSFSFWELLKTQIVMQKNILLQVPKYIVLLCGATSLLPVFLIGIKWPRQMGDTSVAGNILTKVAFVVIHFLFLVLCIWVAFDPPFSPRDLGMGLPFLTFYFLGALCVGYFSGYFIVTSADINGKAWMKPSPVGRAFNKAVFYAVCVALPVVAVSLIYLNLPKIYAQDGTHLKKIATAMASPLDGDDLIVFSDDPANLLLAEAMVSMNPGSGSPVFVDSRSLYYKIYHKKLAARYPGKWPRTLLDSAGVPNPISPAYLSRFFDQLVRSNSVVYLQPTFGFYLENNFLEPHGLVYNVKPLEKGSINPPQMPEQLVNSNNEFWAGMRRWKDALPVHRFTDLDKQAARDLNFVDGVCSRAADYWGVSLQRMGDIQRAGKLFKLALDFREDNVSAIVNSEFNSKLANGDASPIEIRPRTRMLLDGYPNWNGILNKNGPFDEPLFCKELGSLFLKNSLFRQAVIELERAVNFSSGRFEPNLLLARGYLNCGMPSKTLDLIEKIRTGSEFQPLAVSNRVDLVKLEAWSEYRMGNVDNAVNTLKSAQSEFPQSEQIPEALYHIYWFTGRETNAIAAINDQLKISPNNIRALLNKSCISISISNYSEALPSLNRILEINPEHTAAIFNRAIANFGQGNLAAAEKDYNKLLELRPNFHSAYYGLAEIALKRDNKAAAIEYYKKYLEYAPSESAETENVREKLKQLEGAAGE
ncbi:MAG: tetratricopeptide repeat protein [Verrucomicrobia bacterium]|nr:tetratricopeptide repeat protein [Verrucomicrobiota bacterium]